MMAQPAAKNDLSETLPCYILDLPPELCLEVYSYLFPDNTSIYGNYLNEVLAKEGSRWINGPSRPDPGALALLRSCRLVNQEATPIFHSVLHAVVTISTFDEPLPKIFGQPKVEDASSELDAGFKILQSVPRIVIVLLFLGPTFSLGYPVDQMATLTATLTSVERKKVVLDFRAPFILEEEVDEEAWASLHGILQRLKAKKKVIRVEEQLRKVKIGARIDELADGWGAVVDRYAFSSVGKII